MENKVLTLKIYNNEGNCVNTLTNELENSIKLLSLLWSKTVVKSKWIKHMTYKYNCTNYQTISFKLDNDYKFVFENIPASLGNIDEGKILQQINEQIKEGGE